MFYFEGIWEVSINKTFNRSRSKIYSVSGSSRACTDWQRVHEQGGFGQPGHRQRQHQPGSGRRDCAQVCRQQQGR